MEIGAGGYVGAPHCPVAEPYCLDDDLRDDEKKRAAYLAEFSSRQLKISAFSVHNNPLHPDCDVRNLADWTLRKAIQIAQKCNV